MYTLKLRLPHCALESAASILNLVALITTLAQWFIDLLMITSFRSAQTIFQRIWLCFHYATLNALLILLLYGFSAALLEASRSFHGVSNFRSWLLFLGTALTFSGFFVVIGYAKDDALFAASCSHGFDRVVTTETVANATAHHMTVLTQRSTAFSHDTQKCKQIFRALLSTYLLIWTAVQLLLLALFICVNRLKKTRYTQERQEEKEKARLALLQRYTGHDEEKVSLQIARCSIDMSHGDICCPHCGSQKRSAALKTKTNQEEEAAVARPPRRVSFRDSLIVHGETRHSTSEDVIEHIEDLETSSPTDRTTRAEQQPAPKPILEQAQEPFSRFDVGSSSTVGTMNDAFLTGFPVPPGRCAKRPSQVAEAARQFARLATMAAEQSHEAASFEDGCYSASVQNTDASETSLKSSSEPDRCLKCRRRFNPDRRSCCLRKEEVEAMDSAYEEESSQASTPKISLSIPSPSLHGFGQDA